MWQPEASYILVRPHITGIIRNKLHGCLKLLISALLYIF